MSNSIIIHNLTLTCKSCYVFVWDNAELDTLPSIILLCVVYAVVPQRRNTPYTKHGCRKTEMATGGGEGANPFILLVM